MAVTLESLKKSVGKKKTPSRAFAWLADLERASGDLDGALRRVDGGLGLYMNDLPGLLVRSRILFEKEQFEDCVAVCEMALKNDPFCLSAQKRMGDAYDKLGNEAERNKCYRRVHDMDPLDNFWKEEYDVVLGTAAAVEETDFVMPGLSGDDSEAPAADDGGLSFLASGEEASSLVKENTFNTEETPSDESSVFEKSLDSGAESVSSIFSSSAEDNTSSSPFSLDTKSSLEDFNSAEPSIEDETPASTEDDPFAALSAILPNDDENDGASMDSLQASLDAAMSNIEAEDNETLEEFPADENISGGDVSNVLSDMFGDDSLEDSTESKSPFSNLDIPKEEPPDSFNAKDVDAESMSITNDSNMFGLMEKIGGEESKEEAAPAAEPAADQPMSVDSAFASIFGEDELPEELPSSTPAAQETAPAAEESAPVEDIAPASEVEAEEKPAAEPAADQPMSVDSAFASIFGEDELPDENPSPAPAAEESPLADFAEPAAEEAAPAFEESAPALEESPLADFAAEASATEDAALSVDNAFANIFGDDELMDEKAESPLADLKEPAAEEPAAEAAATDDSALSVDNAFANIFGDDELPDEKAESPLADLKEPVAGEFVANQTEEASAPAAEDSLQSIDSAFANIFGADELSDDKNSTEDVSGIFNETPETPVVEPVEETADAIEPEAAPEAASPSLAEQVKNAEDELEIPSSLSKSVESEVGGAFDSIFGGNDDDFAFEKSSSEPTEESTSAAAEESVIPANVENTLESEVSGAFKDLFHTDDDDVLETEEPSNKGVDFLMSGDSDDEVSVGLIKDPSQPLAKNESDIDESLNTKTLAEIYFEQGLYGKALDIYQDLCMKEPSNAEYQQRAEEIEKIYREKFGGNINA